MTHLLQPHYAKGKKHERIDHFLVSPAVIPYITGHVVCSHLLGSDHVPLQLTLCLSPATPSLHSEDDASQSPAAAAESRMPFIIPSSNAAVIQRYQQLVSEPAAWQPLTDLAADPLTTPDQLMHCFKQIMFDAAIAAGYRVKHMTPGQLATPPRPHTSSKYKVWHDAWCRALQSKIRAINRHDADQAALSRKGSGCKMSIVRGCVSWCASIGLSKARHSWLHGAATETFSGAITNLMARAVLSHPRPWPHTFKTR